MCELLLVAHLEHLSGCFLLFVPKSLGFCGDLQMPLAFCECTGSSSFTQR